MKKECKKCNVKFNTKSIYQEYCSECRETLICKIDGCDNKVSIPSKMLCRKHYAQFLRVQKKKPIIRKCKKCEKEFENITGFRQDYCDVCKNLKCRYCSKKVDNVRDQLCKFHYLLKCRGRDENGFRTEVCEICGKEYKTKITKKYCSKMCKIEADKKRRREKSKREKIEKEKKRLKRVCEMCGEEFTPQEFCKNTQHCCSAECRKKYQKIKAVEYYEKNNSYRLGRGKSFPQMFVFNTIKEVFGSDWKYDDRSVVKNPETGRFLELDIWNPKHRIAVEFDGKQHFEPKFGQEMLEYTQKMDKIKNRECEKHNIKLLRIAYNDNWRDEEWIIQKVGELINGDN